MVSFLCKVSANVCCEDDCAGEVDNVIIISRIFQPTDCMDHVFAVD